MDLHIGVWRYASCFSRATFQNSPICSAGRSRLGELLQGADAVLWEVLNVPWIRCCGLLVLDQCSGSQVVTIWSFFRKSQKRGGFEKSLEWLISAMEKGNRASLNLIVFYVTLKQWSSKSRNLDGQADACGMTIHWDLIYFSQTWWYFSMSRIWISRAKNSPQEDPHLRWNRNHGVWFSFSQTNPGWSMHPPRDAPGYQPESTHPWDVVAGWQGGEVFIDEANLEVESAFLVIFSGRCRPSS